MKKLLIISAIIVIAVGSWYFLKAKPGGVSVSKTYTAKGLKAVIDLGIPVKCSYKINDLEYEGYVKGGQWRGTMQAADGRQSEIIIKDNCLWGWDNQTKQGTKLCFEPTEETESIWDNPQNMNSDLEYFCRPAAITDAQFTPPSDIKFIDLDDMINSQGLDMNQMPEPDQIPDMDQIPDSPEDFDMSRYQEP